MAGEAAPLHPGSSPVGLPFLPGAATTDTGTALDSIRFPAIF